jgi:choline-phosphate cytidylyltransferase
MTKSRGNVADGSRPPSDDESEESDAHAKSPKDSSNTPTAAASSKL